jgi:hypothetical protein
MRVLIEHPIFEPYTSISGGTELFVRNAVRALKARGHEVSVFAAADSALPCIKSTVFSKRFINDKAAGKTARVKTTRWYSEIAELAASFDSILLNTTLFSLCVLDPVHAAWFHKAVYFNHNGSRQFVSERAGLAMQSTLRYFRAHGGRTYYFSERNKAALAAQWALPARRALATGERPIARALARLGDNTFLNGEPWDGPFFQGIFPEDAAPAAASEGYLIAIGRDDPREKRLARALKLGKELNREVFVISGEDHGKVMDYLASAEALLLPSRDETFSIVAFEAACHGVPVSCLEVPPALQPFPELTWPWGEWLATTEAERAGVQKELRELYSAEAMGRRLEAAIAGSRSAALS